MTKKKGEYLPKVPQNFPVVGIGGSAGGIEAFKEFIKAISIDSGMAYVFVLHLHPVYESVLPEILAKSTSLPVQEITDEINLVPNHLYVIPENKILTTVDGVLKLGPRNTENPGHLAIDIFFHSLAEVHLNNAIGILMSGMGSDGTLGLKSIKKYGGITFAQDLSSANFDPMPKNAIEADAVDFILPPEEMPQQLRLINQAFEKNFTDEHEKNIPHSYEEVLRQIISLIKQRKGVDFSYYKEPTLRRRIARRMGLSHHKEITAYYAFLKSNKEELNLLLNDFLIPVTSFFRDAKTFQNLSDMVFPKLLENKPHKGVIRVWVAGCSSGQEAYSIAIGLHAFLAERSPETKIQVFATDISESNIDIARQGIYDALDVQAIAPHLLQNYLTKTSAGTYQVNKTIRSCCVFAVHNFLKDPPFSKMDFVSCRNVLIYMTTFLQKKALGTFHYALNENGILWLGKSETISISADLYNLISPGDKFFSRKYTPSHRFKQDYNENSNETRSYTIDTTSSSIIGQPDFYKNADEILLNHYTPPSVIITDQNDIIHFRGDTSLFFMPSPGKASLNVLKMVRKDLSFDLRNLLHKAAHEKESVSKDNVLVNQGNQSYLITIEVVPLLQSVALHYLIIFHKKVPLLIEKELSKSEAQKQKKNISLIHIQELEKELAQTRQDILSITENQENINEELQSANEELLSSSEELQTLNEELETSKEELQSGNEELISMNQELVNRQEHLNKTQAKLEELNRELLIKNKAFEEAQVSANMGTITWNLQTFKLIYSDNLYRLFGYEPGEFTPDTEQLKSFVHPDDMVKLKMLKQESLLKKQINEFSFRAFTKDGTLKYIKATGSVIHVSNEDWLVANLQDISKDVLLNKNLQLREAQLSESQKLGKIGSWEIDFNDNTITWSDETYELYGYQPNEICIDYDTLANVHPDDIEHLKKLIDESHKTGQTFEAHYRRYDKECKLHYIYSKGNVKKDNEGKVTGMLCMSMDQTELREQEKLLKQVNQQLEIKNAELERSNAELASFSYIASHDLEEPLRKIQTFTDRIMEKEKEQLSDNAKDYFNRILRSTTRMKSLLKDLLSYSRINTGDTILVPTDLNGILDEAKNSLSERIEEKKATIDAALLPTLPIVPTQFYQLFVNLLSNSLKYSKEDVPVHIKIETSFISGGEIRDVRARTDQNYHKISFIDNGIGFEQSYEDKIFELFQRLHGKSEYEGTGIGLTICRKVVQNHNGFIMAHGQPGIGATFTIYIPVEKQS